MNWLKILKREDLLIKHTEAYITNNGRLCSDHFEDGMFTSTLKTRLSNFAYPKGQEGVYTSSEEKESLKDNYKRCCDAPEWSNNSNNCESPYFPKQPERLSKSIEVSSPLSSQRKRKLNCKENFSVKNFNSTVRTGLHVDSAPDDIVPEQHHADNDQLIPLLLATVIIKKEDCLPKETLKVKSTNDAEVQLEINDLNIKEEIKEEPKEDEERPGCTGSITLQCRGDQTLGVDPEHPNPPKITTEIKKNVCKEPTNILQGSPKYVDPVPDEDEIFIKHCESKFQKQELLIKERVNLVQRKIKELRKALEDLEELTGSRSETKSYLKKYGTDLTIFLRN